MPRDQPFTSDNNVVAGAENLALFESINSSIANALAQEITDHRQHSRRKYWPLLNRVIYATS
jgi:hypothetical protein